MSTSISPPGGTSRARTPLVPSILSWLVGGCLAACAMAPEGPTAGAPGAPLEPMRAGEDADARAALSPEMAMDTPERVPASGYQGDPAVAFNGTHYLVVWMDEQDPAGQRIYGARVAPDGEAVDTIGIPLGTGSLPAVASDGDGFLVVAAPPEYSAGPIRAVRVSAEGAVLDPEGVALGEPDAGGPVVGFDGVSYQIAWTSGEGALRRTRVTPEAIVLDADGPPIASLGSAHSIACGAAGCLLLWMDDQGFQAARLDAQGSPPAPVGMIAPSEPNISTYSISRRASAAVVGSGYVVTWSEDDSEASRIRAARVSAAGALLDPGGIIVAQEAEHDVALAHPRAVFDGTDVLVAWSRYLGVNGGDSPIDGIELHLARMTPGGAVLDAPGRLVNPAARSFAAASDGVGALFAWGEVTDIVEPMSSASILGARIDARAADIASPGHLVSAAANAQQYPSAAFDGQSFLVVWADERGALTGASSDIYGARVSPAGEVLDDPAFLIASTLEMQADPQVVFDGQSWLVLWSEVFGGEVAGANLFATRVSPGGEVLDATPLDLGLSSEWSPDWASFHGAAASTGHGTLIMNGHETMLAVDQDGAIRDLGPFPVLDPQLHRIAIASQGTEVLSVWLSDRRILGARLNEEGALLDPLPFPVSPGSVMADEPVIAAGGTGYLVVWKGLPAIDEAPEQVLYGARVSAEGEVLDPAGIPLHEGYIEGWPAVSFDRQRWIVTFRTLDDDEDPGSATIRAAEISPEGLVAPTYVVAEAPGLADDPAIASTDDGTTLFAYPRFEADPPYGTHRMKVRLLGAAPAGEAADAPLVIGCSCRAAGAEPSSRPPLLAALAALWLRTRARRSRGRRARRG